MPFRQFVIEAVMLASHGQLLHPDKPVCYYLPYSTILELREIIQEHEPIMHDPSDDRLVKAHINELIQFFESPLNRKKIEKALVVPWKKSSTILVNELVSLVVINAFDHEQYGEMFDPIETELLATAVQHQMPVLTDQLHFTQKIIDFKVPVEVFDIADFEYALEKK